MEVGALEALDVRLETFDGLLLISSFALMSCIFLFLKVFNLLLQAIDLGIVDFSQAIALNFELLHHQDH